MNAYLMQVMAKQRIYDAMREAATARIAGRAPEPASPGGCAVARAREALRRCARVLHGYPAGTPASWRDTSRA
jgi:hypothetical protein